MPLLKRVADKGRRIADRAGFVTSRARVADVMRLDYAEDLKGDSSHAWLIRDLIHSLSKRETIHRIDVESLWRDHLNGDADHASALMTLAGLEVNLRALEQYE